MSLKDPIMPVLQSSARYSSNKRGNDTANLTQQKPMLDTTIKNVKLPDTIGNQSLDMGATATTAISPKPAGMLGTRSSFMHNLQQTVRSVANRKQSHDVGNRNSHVSFSAIVGNGPN